MPDAVLIKAAKSVVDALNAADAGLSQEFTAERSYADWDLPLEDTAPADKVLVDVVPVPNIETELETRGSIGYKPAVDVIVRKRITSNMRDANGRLLLDELDKLVLFVQELAEFLTAERLTGDSDAAWESTEIRRSYVPAHLREKHQFTGQIRISYSTDTTL